MDQLAKVLRILEKSEEFRLLLEIILAIGNYMNGSTFRGCANGFSIDILENISSVKSSTKNGYTLMHYFTEYLQKNYPNLIDFPQKENLSDDMSYCSKLDLDFLTSQVNELDKNLLFVEKEFTFFESVKNDPFASIFKPFIEKSKQKVVKVKSLSQIVSSSFDNIKKYFVLDKSCSCQEFLSITSKFFVSFETAIDENAQRYLRAQKLNNKSNDSKGDLDSMISRMKNFK